MTSVSGVLVRKKTVVVAVLLFSALAVLSQYYAFPNTGFFITRHDSQTNPATTEKKICYVIMHHPEIVPAQQASINRSKSRFEQLSGLPCVVIHFSEIRKEHLQQLNIQAVLLSGIAPTTAKYDPKWFNDFYTFLRELDLPTIGFCGGHQTIARAYGGKNAAMRLLKPGEKDPNPNYYPGYYKEWGFTRVQMLKQDALFVGLGKGITVAEYHWGEVKELPDVFEILASTQECRVQVIKHREKRLYGTQFHPEAYSDKYQDGRIILQNFFRIAGILPASSSGLEESTVLAQVPRVHVITICVESRERAKG